MYWLDSTQQYTGSPTQRDFFCDTSSDIEMLPTAEREGVQQGDDTISCQKVEKGSTCLCISPVALYILNSQDEWKEAKKGG